MERKTIELELPLGWKATVYTYFTQQEYNAIQKIFLNSASFNPNGSTVQGNIPAMATQEADALARLTIVQSLTSPDGEKVGVSAETLGALPFDASTDPLRDHINAITAPSKKAETVSS